MAGELRTPVRILLVEDNPGDALILRRALEEVYANPFELTMSQRLDEAVATLRTNRFDIVFLDLNLPDSEGLDTLQQAGGVVGGAAIIVLTGVDDDALGLEVVRRGAQDYVVKGEVFGWLLWRSIRYSIERKRSMDELAALNEELQRRVAQRAGSPGEAAAEPSHLEQGERDRLARLVHDQLQQLLVRARLRIKALEGRADAQAIGADLADLNKLLGESLEACRSLLIELKPSSAEPG